MNVQVRCDGCGWKGKRQNDREYYAPYGMEPAAEGEPCPHCGGQVRLTPSPLPPVRTVDPDALLGSWGEEEQLQVDLPEEDGDG